MREALAAEPELVILFDDSFKGDGIRKLVEFGDSLGIPVKYCLPGRLFEFARRDDMGVAPDCCRVSSLGRAGYDRGRNAGRADLDVLWVVGANPLKNGAGAEEGLLVVQDMFLTETAQRADVVLPAASAHTRRTAP